VSALGYFLEREGLVTTGISLVRENTESMQPPRALWVTFPLGRPLGVPGDAAFQLDVIRAALDLLDRTEGPVLEDYHRDAPLVDAESAAVCPVSFVKDGAKDAADDGLWKTRLARELSQLKPWYALSCRRRGGRTLVGIADQPPEKNVQILGGHLDDAVIPRDITWLKRAIEDLKAYYIEAMTAQPGDYDSGALQVQFWQETSLGAAILVLFHQFQNSDDDQLKMVARILAPREAIGAATGPRGAKTGGKTID
jgi:D-proline reductase (dithiol) PrdB